MGCSAVARGFARPFLVQEDKQGKDKPKSLASVVDTYNFTDKAAKITAGAAGFAAVLQGEKGQVAANVAKAAKDTRTFTGLFNVFRGNGGALYHTVKGALNFPSRVSVLGKKDHALILGAQGGQGSPNSIEMNEAFDKKAVHRLNPFGVARTTAQKVLALVSEFFKMIGGATYTVGFGLFRPLKFVDSVTPGPDRYTSVTSRFAPCMAVNHVAAAIEHVSAIAFDALVFSAVKSSSLNNEDESDVATEAKEYKRICSNYGTNLAHRTMAFLENGAELGSDVNLFVKLPAIATASLALVASIFSFIRMWMAGVKADVSPV